MQTVQTMNHATSRRLDPRTVIIAFLGLSIWISYATELVSLVAGVVAALACVVIPGSTGQGLARLGQLVRWALPFALIVFVLYVLLDLNTEPILIELGPISVSGPGVDTGTRLGIRFIAFVAAARSLMLYATPSGLAAGLTRFLRPLRHLGLKPEMLYHFVFVTLRLVPGIAAESRTIRFAQRSRGWWPGGRLTDRVRNARAIVIPVFAAAMRRADTLSIVLSSRAVALSGMPPPVDALAFEGIDYVLLFLIIALLTVGILLPAF